MKPTGTKTRGARARGLNKTVVAAIESVAMRLGNTRSVCRKCYIHPAVVDAYLDGATIRTLARSAARLTRGGLRPEEHAVVALIRHQLGRGARRRPARTPGARSTAA